MNTIHTSPSLEINGSPLKKVNYTKSLGVLIDENLWSTSIMAWPNPTLTTALLYGVAVVKYYLKSFKNSKIMQLVYSPSPIMMLTLPNC